MKKKTYLLATALLTISVANHAQAQRVYSQEDVRNLFSIRPDTVLTFDQVIKDLNKLATKNISDKEFQGIGNYLISISNPASQRVFGWPYK